MNPTGCDQPVLAALELTAHLPPANTPQVNTMKEMFKESNFDGTLKSGDQMWHTDRVTDMA